MKKRILSVLLVVAMLASMVVMPVYADNTATQSATPSQYADANGYCLCGCGTLWEDIEWTTLADATEITEAGNYHYRLIEDTDIVGNALYLNSTTNVMNAVLDLNGYTLRIDGRVAYVKAGNTLHIVDSVGTGEVINADLGEYNAGLTGHWIRTDGTTIIYGGSWSNEEGLAVYASATVDNPLMLYVPAGGELTIKDGSFDVSGMEALGAGLMGSGRITSATSAEAVINIEGGTFTGDDSSTQGAWYIRYKGVLNISGGTFNCKVLQSGGTVALSGDVKIEELQVQGGSTIDVEGLTSGAEIGITASPMSAFTDVLTDADAYLGYFTNTNEEYVGGFEAVDGAIKAKWSETAVCPHCDTLMKDITDWKCFNTDCTPGVYASSTGTPNAGEIKDGHYYLNGDIVGTSNQYHIGTNVDLTTNGTGLDDAITALDVCIYTMGCEMTSNTTKRLFYVKPPHDLTIINTVGNATVLAAKYVSGVGGAIYCNSGKGNADNKSTTLEIYNCMLRNNSTSASTKNAGVIHCGQYCHQVFENCVVAGRKNAKDGGAISLSTGETTMNNCVVYGSSNTTGKGAAIFKAGSDFNITNCEIYGGKSATGAAIHYEGSGDVTIKNSTITDGTATTDGAGIYLNNAGGKGGLVIENSTVGSLTHSNHYTKDATKALTYNETKTGLADGVVGNYTLTLKGQVNIGDLDLNEADNSAFLGFTADITAMTGGKVAVTAVADTAFTSALTDADTAKTYAAKYFTSNVDGLNVRYNDATFELILTEGNRYGVCPHCEDQIAEWAPYAHDGKVDLVADAHYYLSEIVSTSSEVAIGVADVTSTPELETLPVDVVIDLDGKTLSCGNRAFTVRSGCSLFLMDSVGGAVLSGGYTTSSGACISVLADAKVTLHSGTYTQNNSKTYTKHGGVISVNGAELIIENNAVVTGGTTTAHGGNIYAGNGSTITIKDNAQVIGGSAQNGGNIYATSEDTTVNISGDAVVSGGTAQNGGNMYLPGGAVLNMTGGTVSDGIAKIDNEALSAKGRGGNIYLGAAEHTISGGTISGGVSQADDPATELGGGNIYVYSGGKLTVSGGTTITGGTSLSNGGNIFTLGALVLEDAAISGGTAANSGADVYIGDTGSIEIALAVTGDLGIGIHDDKYEGTAPYGKKILDSVYNGTDMNSNLKLTLDGVRGNAPIVAQENALWVQDGGVAVVDIDGNYEYFADPADAFDVYDIDSDSWLMVCGADEIVLTENAWIDVNGCDFTVSGAYTASFIDTSNDDYETFGWVTLNGATLGNGNSEDANSTTYYTVEGDDGRYSFHLLDMEITAVSLKTRTGGLYYYAKWYCDDTMKGQIETFGIATQLGSMPTDLTADTVLYSYMSGTELVSGVEQVGATMNNIISTTPIEGYTNDQRGAMKVYAAPYVCLKSGDDVIGTTEVGMSLKDCCDSIDAMITDLLAGDSDDQVKAQEYISYMNDYLFGEAWKDMGLTWTFTNFKQAESTEA